MIEIDLGKGFFSKIILNIGFILISKSYLLRVNIQNNKFTFKLPDYLFNMRNIVKHLFNSIRKDIIN